MQSSPTSGCWFLQYWEQVKPKFQTTTEGTQKESNTKIERDAWRKFWQPQSTLPFHQHTISRGIGRGLRRIISSVHKVTYSKLSLIGRFLYQALFGHRKKYMAGNKNTCINITKSKTFCLYYTVVVSDNKVLTHVGYEQNVSYRRRAIGRGAR